MQLLTDMAPLGAVGIVITSRVTLVLDKCLIEAGNEQPTADTGAVVAHQQSNLRYRGPRNTTLGVTRFSASC